MPMFLGGVPVSAYTDAHRYLGNKFANSKLGQTSFGQALVNTSRKLNDFLGDVTSRVAPVVDKYGMPVVRNVTDFINDIPVAEEQPAKKSFGAGNSAHVVSQRSTSPSTVNYLNAELAKQYGMGRSTAYQEALSNTAYQRAVKDMKAAGLNPAAIFGSGKGYTAGGVSYIQPENDDSGSGWISGRSSGYRSSSSGKLFSEGAYHAISTAVGLAGMAAMKKGPIGYYISETAAKSVMGALNEIFS